MPAMKNSPLVEIIAEVRWGPGNPHVQNFVLGSTDASSMKFAMEIAQLGYNQVERTQPEGMPAIGGHVLYRYRKADGNQNTLYQLGHGVLTANGLAPYSSWPDFEPVLGQVLDIACRVGVLPQGQQAWVILRYVDAFEEKHLGDASPEEFMSKVLGVTYVRPRSIDAFPLGEVSSSLRFQAGTQSKVDQSGISIEAGIGQASGADAVILNTQLVSAPIADVSPDSLIGEFRRLQRVAHDVFFEMLDRDPPLRDRLVGEG